MSRAEARLRAVPERAERALLLIRVSKEREGMIAPELQRDATREHCARRGYEVVDTIEGIDESGSRARSAWWPRLDAAIARVVAGEVDVIVVWELSRTARNRLRWAVALDQVEAAGGRIESATEPIDQTTAAGRFQRGMLAEMHAYRAEAIGEGWKATIARRRRAGLPHSGGQRFGYRPGDDGRFEPDPETAPILAEAYRRYVAGAGLRALCTWLTALGIRTSRGGLYSHDTLGRMLDSGFGAGLLRVHDPDCTARHPAGTDVGRCPQRTYLPGAHPAVIDTATWDAYLDARADRATVAPRHRRASTPLSGVARCGACGYTLTYEREKTRKRGTQAPRLSCLRTGCRRSSVRYSVAEAAVVAWLPTVEAQMGAAAASAEQSSAAARVQAERAARAVTDAARALAQLTVDHARRIVPTSAYEAARDALVAEQSAAQAALERLTRRASASADHAMAAARLLETWGSAPAEDLAPMLRGLCTVWVIRRDGARGCDVRVVGAWEPSPEPTRPIPRD